MRFKISLLFITLSVAILLTGGLVVRHLVLAEQATATTDALRRAANAAALTMDVALEARQRDLTALAAAIGASSHLIASDQTLLQNWLAAYKQAGFVWLAVVDPQGRVVASTGQALEGDNMSTAVWFQRGLQGRYTSDQHALTWPAAGLANGGPWGVLMATPLPPLAAPAAEPVAVSPNAGVLVAMLGDVWRKELRDTLVQMQPAMAGTDKPSLWLRTRTGMPLTQDDQAPAPPVDPGQCGLRSGCNALRPARPAATLPASAGKPRYRSQKRRWLQVRQPLNASWCWQALLRRWHWRWRAGGWRAASADLCWQWPTWQTAWPTGTGS